MITVLTPDDLDRHFINKDIDDLIFTNFYTRSIKIFAEADFVIYIQDNDNWKILKNRYPIEDERTKKIIKLFDINV